MTMTTTTDQFIHALTNGYCLDIRYGDTHALKTVEVHAVSPTHARVYQVAGESSRPLPNWALLKLDQVNHLPSLAPRPGYKMGDKHLQPNILAEIQIDA